MAFNAKKKKVAVFISTADAIRRDRAEIMFMDEANVLKIY